jgi:hypothetical protein
MLVRSVSFWLSLRKWFPSWERTILFHSACPPLSLNLNSPIDLARAARLRLTGNGVVSLQAAYAWRVLWERFE